MACIVDVAFSVRCMPVEAQPEMIRTTTTTTMSIVNKKAPYSVSEIPLDFVQYI